MSDTSAHFDRLLGLLELESQAEARQIVERIRRLPAAEAERAAIAWSISSCATRRPAWAAGSC